MEYFDRLGTRIEEAWTAEAREEERFPSVAMRALADDPPLGRVDLDELIDELLDPHRPAARQLAPLGAFGQPGVTVFYGRGFVIDVYFWTSAISAIHNHPFCGVFTLLRGFSAHAVYRFEERATLGPRVRVGELSLTDLTLVTPGHVEPFSLREHPLLHALVHVAVPSVSMVVRTVRTLGYLRYFPPALAIAMDEPDDPIARQLALLDMLRDSGDGRFLDRLERFLEHADFEASFRALSRTLPACAPNERTRLVDKVRDRHGAHADAIVPALERALRVQEGDAIRARLNDDDDRLLATALMLGDSRERVLGLVAARHSDPGARLHRFVDEAGLYVEGEEASAHIAHGLIDGEDLAAIETRLVEEYGEDAVREQRSAIAAYAKGSLFAVLGK